MKPHKDLISNTSNLSRTDLEKMVFDMQNLLDIAISLSSNLKFDSLIDSILYICIGQLLIDEIAIFIHSDLNSDDLNLHKQRGYELSTNLTLQEDSKIIQLLKEKNEIIFIDEIRDLEELNEDDQIIMNLNADIIIPLKSKDTLNGLIITGKSLIEENNTFDKISFLSYMGKFASIAVENSRLYQMATTDRMSGLFIHHYFKERLFEEINRADRYNRKLVLLMLDIDYFKNINDTYGHTTGDHVINELSQIIKNNIRNFDIPARYGGEEFAVILPDIDIDEGFIIAERIRKKFQNHEFKFNDNTINITISTGISKFVCNSNTSVADFINNTDSALYTSKREGRNRTSIYGKN